MNYNVSEYLLKRYMRHVYKWTGKFEFDNEEDAIFDDSPDGQTMRRLEREIIDRASNLSENIVEKTLLA